MKICEHCAMNIKDFQHSRNLGYYCNGSTILPNPPDGSTGGGCPLGHYCPTGTSVPFACPMGYYLDMILSSVSSACKICKLGKILEICCYNQLCIERYILEFKVKQFPKYLFTKFMDF